MARWPRRTARLNPPPCAECEAATQRDADWRSDATDNRSNVRTFLLPMHSNCDAPVRSPTNRFIPFVEPLFADQPTYPNKLEENASSRLARLVAIIYDESDPEVVFVGLGREGMVVALDTARNRLIGETRGSSRRRRRVPGIRTDRQMDSGGPKPRGGRMSDRGCGGGDAAVGRRGSGSEYRARGGFGSVDGSGRAVGHRTRHGHGKRAGSSTRCSSC